jgi:osmotically-inducible protein OsmY
MSQKKRFITIACILKMKNKFILLLFLLLTSCVGTSSSGVFGTGVSVALDPRSLGTQIDDSIMQKNLIARLILKEKSYFLKVKIKVLDGRIFLTGKVDDPEEKLQITKIAWETEGTRSVRNDIKVKEEFSFKRSAKDLLITSQLRTAIIFNKKIKATNYQIDTFKKKIFIYGIALTIDERAEVINEAKEILDVKDVVASILLVEDLRIQKN